MSPEKYNHPLAKKWRFFLPRIWQINPGVMVQLSSPSSSSLKQKIMEKLELEKIDSWRALNHFIEFFVSIFQTSIRLDFAWNPSFLIPDFKVTLKKTGAIQMRNVERYLKAEKVVIVE